MSAESRTMDQDFPGWEQAAFTFGPAATELAPDVAHQLKLFEYLVEFDDQPIILPAVPAAAESLRSGAPAHWRIGAASAAQMTDEAAMVVRCAAALGVVIKGAATLGALTDALLALRRNTLLPVLFVEEAQLLAPSLLERLLHLQRSADGSRPLARVVLCGAVFSSGVTGWKWRVLTVPLSTRTQAPAVERAPAPAAPDPVPDLSAQSEPESELDLELGAAKPPAPEAPVVERAAPPATSQPKPASKSRIVWQWAGLVTLLLVVGVVLLMQDRINALFQSAPPAARTVEQRLVLPPAEPLPRSAEADPMVSPPSEAAAELAAAPEENVVSPVDEPPRIEAPAAVGANAEAVAADSAPAPVAAAPEKPAVAKSSAKAASAPAVPGGSVMPAPPAAGGELRHADWLLQQDPAHYALQLISMRREEEMLDFVSKRRLDAPAAYYRKHRADGDWYVLVYGVYPDKAGAQQALGALPRPLARLKPMLKPFSEIRSDLAGAAP